MASNASASSSSSSSFRSLNNGSNSSKLLDISQGLVRDLAQVFSRGQDESFSGLTPGFLEGSQHQRLVRGRAPRHRGLCLGRVAEVTPLGVVIENLLQPVKRGDGLVVDQGRPEQDEEGGAVWELYRRVDSCPPGAAGAGRGHGRGGASRTRKGGRGDRGGRGQVLEGEAAPGTAVEVVFGPGQVTLLLALSVPLLSEITCCTCCCLTRLFLLLLRGSLRGSSQLAVVVGSELSTAGSA
jgi:hypothetical protein